MSAEPALAQIAEELFGQLLSSHPLSYRPVLEWRRLRVSAGIAYYRQRKIALSSIVLVSEESVRETLIHEYAHLLAVDRHGPQAGGHGRAWKQAMIELGVRPQVRHRFEVQRNEKRQVVRYQCARCGTLIERSRRLPKKRKYLHTGCGGAIRLHSVQPKESKESPASLS